MGSGVPFYGSGPARSQPSSQPPAQPPTSSDACPTSQWRANLQAGGWKAEDVGHGFGGHGHGFGGHGHGSEGWRRLQAGTGRRCVRRVVEGRFPAMRGVLRVACVVRGAWRVRVTAGGGSACRAGRERGGRILRSFYAATVVSGFYANSKVRSSGGRKAQPAIEPPRSTSRHRATSRQRATSWHYVKREPTSHKLRISHLSHGPDFPSRTSLTPRH